MKFALSKDDFASVCGINGDNIDFCIFSTPPTANTVKEKGQFSLRVQLPHLLSANILVDVANMIGDKPGFQLCHCDFRVVAFNERAHGVNKSEPERKKIIFNAVLPLLLVSIFFSVGGTSRSRISRSHNVFKGFDKLVAGSDSAEAISDILMFPDAIARMMEK